MNIRRFEEKDAEAVSKLIGRNFVEINSKDYPLEEMKEKALLFSPDKVKERARKGHMYVICDNDSIVATGTISDFWGSATESILLTIFVLPEYHGIGIGRKLIETLEKDELFLRAERTEVCASITACGFYEKCGYKYKAGIKRLDEEGHYRMEKHRKTE